MEKQKIIEEVLYETNLYKDVINLILDYSKLTQKERKELGIDKKSLARKRNNEIWTQKIDVALKKLDDVKKEIERLQKYKFYKDITKPPEKYLVIDPRPWILPIGRIIYPKEIIYRDDKNDEIVNVDYRIENLQRHLEMVNFDIRQYESNIRK